MRSDEIVPLVKQKIPTIVGFDPISQTNTIGDAARRIGLNGKTTVFNFKPIFGLGDKEFSSTKKYWYWVPETPEHPQRTETFTAKEAAQRFLQTLLSGIEIPERLIIGEPAIRDQTWKENFRRHMRDVFSSMSLTEPIFFPEPFAVFQYYRHIDKTLPVASRPEIVLISTKTLLWTRCNSSFLSLLFIALATPDRALRSQNSACRYHQCHFEVYVGLKILPIPDDGRARFLGLSSTKARRRLRRPETYCTRI